MGVDKEPKARRRPGRVPTSCAECRRLKLRCDRNVPCEKCVSRGCGSICPDGALTSGKGNRLVLANTEELHDRIEHLCSRIRELETALRVLQETVSNDPHPLLRSDLLQLKVPQSAIPASNASSSNGSSPSANGVEPEAQSKHEDENFIDAFGTLTIGLHGESSFLGKTARSEYLIRALSKPPRASNIVLPRISKRILETTCRDEASTHDESIGREVFSLLPPLSEAIHLCDVYVEYGKFAYTAIPRTELFDEVLATVYRAESFDSVSCYHTLSLLFSIFALATLFDRDRPPYSIEAREYYYLARAAIGFSPSYRDLTLNSIQALIHMTQYQELSDWEALGTNSAWTTIGLAVRSGYSVGLHLNSSRWKLSDDATQRRSRVFWQLFALDTWMSFSFGRPPSISTTFVDCVLPRDPEEVINSEGQRECSYHTWSWQYSMLMHSIISSTFGSKQPAYSVVVDLDRKVRDFPVPVNLRWVCDGAPLSTCVAMQRWCVLACKESTLLNLHRAYFAQALHDRPNDLTNHRYLPSVMATYRSAWRLIQSLRFVWEKEPAVLARISLAWSQALSAAIVMCILITRAPNSKMTKSSLEELDSVAKLFEEASPSCRSAANILETVLNLRRKAHEAVDQTQSQDTAALSPAELDRLGGRTHLISQLASTPASTPQTAFTPPAPQEAPALNITTENMHPTIAQDMRNLDVGSLVYNLFDLPTDSLPPDDQMPDIQFADNMFNQQPMGAFSMGQQGSPQTPGMGFGAGAPILDATWQSFVEQLGF